MNPSLFIAVGTSVLAAAVLIGAFVALMTRVVSLPHTHHAARLPRRTRPNPRAPGWTAGDPEWWPEFERQFAEYVETPRR